MVLEISILIHQEDKLDMMTNCWSHYEVRSRDAECMWHFRLLSTVLPIVFQQLTMSVNISSPYIHKIHQNVCLILKCHPCSSI